MSRKIPAYLINLNISKDRLRAFRKRADAVGLTFQRVEGVDGRRVAPSSNGVRIGGSGARGCALSHRKVARIFLRTSSRFCIVMEDDAMPVRPLPDTVRKVRQLKRKARVGRGGMDIMYLQHMKAQGRRVVGGYGTYGYILTRPGARKLLQLTRGCTSPIDLVLLSHFAGRGGRRGSIRAYAAWERGVAKPFIAHRPVNGSVIKKVTRSTA